MMSGLIILNLYKQDIKHKGIFYKKENAFIIPKKQKKSRLINAMFESRTKFKDSLFYDVSAWTLPLAFNLDYDMNFDMSNTGEIASSKTLNEKIKNYTMF